MASTTNPAAALMLPTTAPYPAAILLATFSLLVVLLLLSPLCWHFRNRNIGATMLVAWTLVMNLQTFVNALIWPHDDIPKWFSGRVLCDIESNIQMGWMVAASASLAAVLRALANAIDTSRATLTKSRAQRIRDYAIDISFCIGFPALQVLLHYIVQPRRYAIVGIAGCFAVSSDTWLSFVLMEIPPLTWTIIDTYYAIVILVRLCRYRVTMGSILASSNMSKNRFLRLYIFCIVFIVAFVPLQAFTISTNLAQGLGPFLWSEVHDPKKWNEILMEPSYGKIPYQQYIWLVGGIFIFIFFGMGRDASKMYKDWLRSLGFARLFPSLQPGHTPRHSAAGTINSLSSKAKLVFKRKSSASWQTDSYASKTTSTSDPASPKHMTFLDTIDENDSIRNRAVDLEKGVEGREPPSLITRVASVFKKKPAAPSGVPLFNIVGPLSQVAASNASGGSSIEVIVRKEVRQSSETAETMAPATFHAA